MLFSSLPFLYTFLPCVILIYFLVPDRWKNMVLLLSSLIFYGWGERRFLIFMIISIAQSYVLGCLVQQYRQDQKRAKNL